MRIAAALAIVALLSFGPRAIAAADPFNIDVILPLTGPATFVGKGSQQGLQGVEAAAQRDGRH